MLTLYARKTVTSDLEIIDRKCWNLVPEKTRELASQMKGNFYDVEISKDKDFKKILFTYQWDKEEKPTLLNKYISYNCACYYLEWVPLYRLKSKITGGYFTKYPMIKRECEVMLSKFNENTQADIILEKV